MGVNPTEHQQEALDAIRVWFEKQERQTFSLGGLAGTGKSTIIPFVIDALGLEQHEVLFCAPTNKAKNVLKAKLRSKGIGSEVSTIHKIMMTPTEVHCDNCPLSRPKPSPTDLCHGSSWAKCGCELAFVTRGSSVAPQIIICDESSMVTDELYDELIGLSEGLPILFVGDHGQLAPVGNRLDKDFSVMSSPDFELHEIHRGHSTIHQLAYKARLTGRIEHATYDAHVRKISWGELEELEFDARTFQGITFFRNPNKHQAKGRSVPDLNTAFRESLGLSGRPKVGERVIAISAKVVDKGTIGFIKEIDYLNQHLYKVTITIPGWDVDYRSTIHAQPFGYHEDQQHRQYDLWDFGYVITCHKAQGSEFENVIVFEPPEEYRRWTSYRRWIYTAITRAKVNLTIVG